MARRDRATLKRWFRRGEYPTEGQFGDVFDSFVHADEDRIGISQVDGLEEELGGKYDAMEGAALARNQAALRKDFDSHRDRAKDKLADISEELTGLHDAVDAKADDGHTHDISDISGISAMTDEEVKMSVETAFKQTGMN